MILWRRIVLVCVLVLEANTWRARARTDGALDSRWNVGAGASDDILSVATLPNGGLLLGGYFTAFDGHEKWRLARLHSDGSLDAAFDPGDGSGSAPITQVAILPNGKILAAGAFTRFNNLGRPLVVRLQPDGQVDAKFNAAPASAGLSGRVSRLAVLPDGKLLVGGRLDAYTSLRQPMSMFLVRLLPDGGLDRDFVCEPAPKDRNDQLTSLVVLDDGRLLLGTRTGIVRLSNNGALDRAFQTSARASGAITAISVQKDSKILVADAPTLGGWQLIRLEQNGKLDPSFVPVAEASNHPGGVDVLLACANGKILVGGSFREISGKRRHGLARLKADGSLDTSFDPGTGAEVIPLDEADETPEPTVRALLPLADGGLLIAGRFDLYNGSVCHNVARLYDGEPPPSLLPKTP